jgi:hypothetical protein
MSDLEDILSGRETAPVVENIKETEAKADVEQPEQPQEPPVESEGQNESGNVPVAALQAERQKAKTYREQVADFDRRLAEQNQVWENRFNQLFSSLAQPKQPQEAPKAPDFWEAPETAIDYRLNQAVAPVQSQLQQMREDFSRMQAIDKHGQEAVDKAFAEMSQRMQTDKASVWGEYQRIMASPHPYGSLVDWHKKQQALAEIGSDPAAYKEKLKAELLAELQQTQQPPAPQAQAPVMPSNFANVRNVGSRAGPAWSGPQPIQDIFKR